MYFLLPTGLVYPLQRSVIIMESSLFSGLMIYKILHNMVNILFVLTCFLCYFKVDIINSNIEEE